MSPAPAATGAPFPAPDGKAQPVVALHALTHAYGKTRALDDVTLDLPAGCMVGLVGPDGVGKSTLLAIAAGARRIQTGRALVLGGDMAALRHRESVGPAIAYMPQGLGKNLYPTLSVFENIDFFGRLFGQGRAERERRIAGLLERTGLSPFADRPAGKLSGGMKQKVSLCCALIHDPDLLILDEPTTGVDPLSRRQFWELIDDIRAERAGMSVIVATAYMEEAARFDWIVAMDAGRVLATGTPADLMARTGTRNLDDAFVELLPPDARAGHAKVVIPPLPASANRETAIEAEGLTMRFGDFTAVDHVSFRIGKGEIFGFLGSNGCGKTTTMKMLTGLLPATEGTARLFGKVVDARDMAVRRRVGYMSQAFSLYSELTVEQNLVLHARLFGMDEALIPARVREMAERFELDAILADLPERLPLGIRQRLSLAVALIHSPEVLILDEPTSGVDPVARDRFWQILSDLSRKDGVTIFVSTHFMNEAELCDRISLMHAGRVLVSDTAAAITESRGAATLEEAFIACLEEASGLAPSNRTRRTAPDAAAQTPPPASDPPHGDTANPIIFCPQISPPEAPVPATPNTAPNAAPIPPRTRRRLFDARRMLSYSRRETLELRRDPIRAAMALFGSLILMFVIGFGINMDVEDMTFAVLDRDQTALSRDYALQIAGSRYFDEQPPITSYEDLDRRMRAGDLALAIEIPPGFARDVARGKVPEVGAWIDGSMPMRAETVQGYVQGMHTTWLTQRARELYGAAAVEGDYSIEIRYRYNPDVASIIAIVPAVIPLLLLMIPAMLTALSVVREKELGSIVNLYVTPVTKLEFLVGKQLPYVALAMLNFALMTAFAVTFFGVPFKGDLLALTVGALVYVIATTAMGLLVSAFLSSQIAAIFGTAIFTLIPGAQYSGMIDPVSSLEGAGRFIGSIYPTTHFMTIARGTFSKALGFGDLGPAFAALLIAGPLLIGLGAILLRKQER